MPVVVTGLPDTVKMLAGNARPTLDVVPEPALAQDVFPEPSVIRTLLRLPFVIGRLKIVPVPAAALAPIATEPEVAPSSVREPPTAPLRPSTGDAVADQSEAPRLRIVP